MQIEKFNQIERVVEKNQVLPKWRITKFGKEVISQAKGVQKKTDISNRDIELLRDITIPSDETLGFIPVQVQPDLEPDQVHAPGQLHFLFPNGIQVMCPESVSPEVLKTLLNS